MGRLMEGTKVNYEINPKGSEANLSLEVEFLEEGNFSIAVLMGGIAEPVAYKGILGIPEKGRRVHSELVLKREKIEM